MTDPIADFLTRIRNAYQARQKSTVAPYSKLAEKLSAILQTAGYLDKVEVTKDPQTLKLTLKYQGKYAAINGLKRLSAPGRRLYSKAQNLKPIMGGQGLTILSTSRGLMTDREARQARLGGELLCQIW